MRALFSTPTGRFASSGMALSTTIWRFAGPGTAFWAPRQVLLALERRFGHLGQPKMKKKLIDAFDDPSARREIYGEIWIHLEFDTLI